MNTAIIRNIDLFESLTEDELREMSGILTPSQVAAGEVLVREGESGERLYVLVEGEVDVIKGLGTAAQRSLGIRQPGVIIGEISLFTRDHRHTASIVALTPLELFATTPALFESLLNRMPHLARRMLSVLSSRLASFENIAISELQEKNRELTLANAQLKAAQVSIVEAEKRKSELAVARSIQGNMLPSHPPVMAGFEFGVVFEPMLEVGGDFYDFNPLDENRVAVAVGDVSDHGPSAAIFMAITFSLLRAEAVRAESPSAALQRVNQLLLGMNKGQMFVTVLYGVLDRRTREFSYSRAGHNLPMVLDTRGDILPQQSGFGQLLGIEDDIQLDQQTVTLPEGGLLLLLTDGVTDAVDRQGEIFGAQRLKSACQLQSEDSAQSVCQRVHTAVRRHRGDFPSNDDFTLVAVRLV